MSQMKTGFYRLGHQIYYGAYPANQVSGWAQLSSYPPELLKTDHPFAPGERANLLLSNHRLTQQEMQDLPDGFNQLADCLAAQQAGQPDFASTEHRLELTLPEELKLLHRGLTRLPGLTQGKERFLPLDELQPPELEINWSVCAESASTESASADRHTPC